MASVIASGTDRLSQIKPPYRRFAGSVDLETAKALLLAAHDSVGDRVTAALILGRPTNTGGRCENHLIREHASGTVDPSVIRIYPSGNDRREYTP